MPTGLQDGHKEGQPDGHGHEEEVVDGRSGELSSRQVDGRHGKTTLSVTTSPTLASPTLASPTLA